MKGSKEDKIINSINGIIIVIFSLICIYPIWYVLIASISNPDAVIVGKVWLLPKGITFESYKKVLGEQDVWRAYANSILYTGLGTLVAVVLTVFAAYPLSKPRLRGRKFFMLLILMTMWVSPGMIPIYLNIRSLHLIDTYTVMCVAFGCTAFYVVIVRTYFESLSPSLEESAKLDGANDLQIFWRIYLPLSKPSVATISLYYAVTKWNSYLWSMILLKDDKIPLQVLLRKLVVMMDVDNSMLSMDIVAQTVVKETVIYATIVVAIIPMIVLYPFIQKYFVSGIMVGAVKG